MTPQRHTALVIASTWDGVPILESERVRVALSLTAEVLAVDVESPFHGDPPPPGPAGSCDGLWEFEVVEVFLVGEDERYLEIELSPHGHHLALQLHHPRQVTARDLPVRYRCSREGGWWRGRAEVSAALLPPGLATVNAFAIHGIGPGRRFLAAHPTGGERPDFHRIAGFPSLDW